MNDDNSYIVTAEELQSFVERIESENIRKKEIMDDIREIYSEAKGRGYDTKIIRKIIGLRRQAKEARDEETTLLEVYMNALNMN